MKNNEIVSLNNDSIKQKSEGFATLESLYAQNIIPIRVNVPADNLVSMQSDKWGSVLYNYKNQSKNQGKNGISISDMAVLEISHVLSYSLFIYIYFLLHLKSNSEPLQNTAKELVIKYITK